MNLTDQLAQLPKREQITDWMRRRTGPEQQAIHDAFATSSIAGVHRILSEWDDDPFPFTLSALTTYARSHKEGTR